MENQNTKINEMNELESVKALNEVSMELLRHKKADHTKCKIDAMIQELR